MRFQKGIGSPYRRVPRGPGRGDPPYRLSLAAYQARLRNLASWNYPRTPAETQRLRIEIALGTLRGEKYRAMARRLGCSHVYCRKVALGYRAGRLPFLPLDEASLLLMREGLDVRETATETALAEPARANIGIGFEHGGMRIDPTTEPPLMTTDESIAERWREVREEQRENPVRRRHVLFSVPVRG